MNTSMMDNLFGSSLRISENDKRVLYAAVKNGIYTDGIFDNNLRPLFADAWQAFYIKRKLSDPHIKDVLGGKILINAQLTGTAKWENFCTVRISHALNKSGARIPYIQGKTVSSKLSTSMNSNEKDWHLYLVENLDIYLTSKWGTPDIHLKGGKGTIEPKSLSGHNGLIIFKIHYRDATGHASLWNGNSLKLVDKGQADMLDFFKKSTDVKLWKLP